MSELYINLTYYQVGLAALLVIINGAISVDTIEVDAHTGILYGLI